MIVASLLRAPVAQQLDLPSMQGLETRLLLKSRTGS
jgi:hypothetical protein